MTGYELFRALILWIFTGFKGSINDHLDKKDNVKHAYVGFFMYLIFLLFVIAIIIFVYE